MSADPRGPSGTGHDTAVKLRELAETLAGSMSLRPLTPEESESGVNLIFDLLKYLPVAVPGPASAPADPVVSPADTPEGGEEVAGMSVGRPKETRASGHSGRAAGTGGTAPTIPAADPADTIRRAREHAGYDDMSESLREPFLALCDLAAALLAVGERDRRHMSGGRVVYLAGPISLGGACGADEIAEFTAVFALHAERLRAAGYEVVNPCECELQETWEDYMRLGLTAVCRAYAVVVLPRWLESRGAVLEAYVARQLGIPVIPIEAFGAGVA